MKKMLLILFISLGCFAQNQTANQQLQPLSGGVDLPQDRNSMPLLDAATIKRLRETGKRERETYRVIQDSAEVAYKQNDFKKCIYLYEKASRINQFLYDAYFQYIAGVSFYKISVELSDKQYRKRAKALLKQADYHGYVDARLFLKDNF